jgi:pyruvate dehydrogenase E1 component
LGINSDLYLRPTEEMNPSEIVTISGRRIPIVSVHDGEAGLLDNLGSIVGVRHESCAVRRHSKCGRPDEIYQFQSIDSASVVEACGKVLSETALEQTFVNQRVLIQAHDMASNQTSSPQASRGACGGSSGASGDPVSWEQ